MYNLISADKPSRMLVAYYVSFLKLYKRIEYISTIKVFFVVVVVVVIACKKNS